MKRFLGKLTIYVIPFVLLCAPFLYVAVKSNEITDFDVLINKQNQSDDMLLGLGYNEQTVYYKLKNANDRKATVMALGTSRVMQFRGDFFLTSFYNCGGAVKGHYDEYVNFLVNMDEEALPQYLIVGFDSWNFNERILHDDIYLDFQEITKKNLSKSSIVKRIGTDYFRGKWNMTDFVHGRNNIGFNGIFYGDGFRKDGSYCITESIVHPERAEDYEFKDTFQRIANGESGYEYGQEINRETLQCAERLLAYCESHDIIVIGVIPPYCPTALNQMEQSGKYEYLWKIAPNLERIFQDYHYELYDFTDIREIGCDDSYFVDGFHGSEVAYGKILYEISEQSPALRSYVDRDKLMVWIDNRYSNKLFSEPD